MPEERFDAIVIGAGPAGSLSALGLARLGWRTLLVDRSGPGRAKACGHCLSGRARSTLGRHGLLNAVERIALGETRRLRVHAAGRRAIETRLEGGDGGAGWVVERSMLDQALCDEAAREGVEVARRTSARLNIVQDGSGAPVRLRSGGADRDVRADLVVGADGLGSAVAHTAGLCGLGRAGRKYGFSFDLAGADGEGARLRPGVVEMFLARGRGGGYLGVVAHADGSLHAAGLVGAERGVRSRGGPRAAADPFDFTNEMRALHPELRRMTPMEVSREAARGFVAAGPMPWRPERVASGAVALVGDAAGYREPFTGEGMSWALESASLLVDVASRVRPGEWGAEEASAYERAWRRRIGRGQRVCGALAAALERPGLVGVACAAPSGVGNAIAAGIARRVASA